MKMKRTLIFAMLWLLGASAYADTPGAKFINSFTFDGSGTVPITSTTNGTKKGLDIYMVNPASAPGLVSTVFGGTVVDPRDIRVLTPADVVTAQQGGSWTFSLTGPVPLPIGAATEATLSAINTKTPALVSGRVPVDGSGVTQPVSAAALPLPTGAATSALQTIGNTSLSSIDTKIPAPVSGRTPVDGSGVTQPVSAVALPLPTGAATSALQTAGNGALNSIDLKTPTQGQKTMANSSPVVIASDQSALPISIANIDTTLSSRASESTLSTFSSKFKTWDLDSGAGTDNNVGVNLRFAASGGSVEAGTVLNPIRVDPTGTTTQPVNGTVTANIGTPGSLALESTQLAMSAKLPASLGQKTMANSLAVTWASDQSGLSVAQSGTWNINNITGTVSLPTGAATSALQTTINSTIQASQPRKMQDGAGNNLTSQISGAQRALDVGVNVAGVQVDPRAIRALTSGTDSVATTQVGTWNINNISGTVSLPTGAATSALQTSGNASLTSIDGKTKAFDLDTGAGTDNVQGVNLRFAAPGGSVQAGTSSNPIRVDPTGTTPQPVSGTVAATQSGTWNITNITGTVSLPTGAATAANQTAEIAAIAASQPRKLQDGVGNAISSTVNSGKRSLDVNVTGSNMLTTTANQGAPNTIANRWPVQLTDGTNLVAVNSNNALKVDATATIQGVKIVDPNTPANMAAVKPASTAALATDPSLVVAISPNTPLTVGGTVAATQSGVWNINNISGTVSLPTGAATSALQTTGNASLGSIDAKLTNGTQKTQITNGADDADILNTAPTGTEFGLITRNIPSGTQPVSGTVTANQGGTWNINNISGTISLPTGAATESTLSAINAKLPGTLGQKTSANSFAVVVASDQSALPVSQSGTWSVRNLDGAGNSLTSQVSGSQRALDVGINVSGVQVDPRQVRNLTAADVVTAEQGSAPWSIQGDVASGATDSGNPVKIGGVFNTTLPTLTNGQRGDVQLDSSARLVIRPLTSSGDSVSAAQSGTWNINNVSGTISLPTGAATSALQTTGNSSLASIDGKLPSTLGQKTMANSLAVALASDQTVIPVSQSGTWNINNISGTISLPTGAATESSLAKLTQTIGSTTSGQSGPLVQGAVTTSAPSYTTAQTNPLSLDTSGYLRTTLRAAGSSGSTVPDRTILVGGSDGTNLQNIATDTSGNTKSVGNVASGAFDLGFPIKTGGRYNATTQSFSDGQRADTQVDSRGYAIVTRADGFKATYNAASGATTLAANPTDFFTITGSATKTVKVTAIHASCTMTTGRWVNLALIRRSTANTGGTSTVVTTVPNDTTDPAATATVRAYTANPTLGTTVGSIRREKIAFGTPALQVGGGNTSTSVNVTGFVWRASEIAKAITLRGTSQVLALNLGGQTTTGASCNMWVEWTEE